MKKTCLSFIISFLLAPACYTQSVGIGINAPNASSLLELSSSTKGMLVPRMTSAQRTAIISPAKGLLVFDNTTSSFWYFASVWKEITTGSNGWNLTGNAGVDPVNNFIGTTDNQPLSFRVNNHTAGQIGFTNGNTFLGNGSNEANTTGSTHNVGIGDSSLFNLNGNSGGSNTAIGTHTLFSTNGSSANTAIGGFSMLLVDDGGFNTAVGLNTLTNNISGDSNTALGSRALQFTTSSRNTAAGTSSLRFNSTGSENTALGFEALYSNGASSYNTAAGAYALHNNNGGVENSAFGFRSLYANTSGNYNTGTGAFALAANTGGTQNVAEGFLALNINTVGSSNTAVGMSALAGNATGNNNVAIGSYALSFLGTGSNNIAIGAATGTAQGPGYAGLSNTISIGNYNFLNSGSNQVLIGDKSITYIGGNVGWSQFSDERIKSGIKAGVKGLDFITRLKPVTYHHSLKQFQDVTGVKDSTDYPGKYDIEKINFSGFLAQDVEKAAIESHYDLEGIHKPKKATDLYSLTYSEFVVPLVKAVQEQQELIEAQQIKIFALEKQTQKMAAMQADIEVLKAA